MKKDKNGAMSVIYKFFKYTIQKYCSSVESLYDCKNNTISLFSVEYCKHGRFFSFLHHLDHIQHRRAELVFYEHLNICNFNGVWLSMVPFMKKWTFVSVISLGFRWFRWFFNEFSFSFSSFG